MITPGTLFSPTFLVGCVPGSVSLPNLFSIRDRRPAGGPHWPSLWWQKVLEVLPVLAVGTLGVVGTFLYLLVADGCRSLPH